MTEKNILPQRDMLMGSTQVGCAYCKTIFSPDQIHDWCDEDIQGRGQTGLCPYCGVDALLGDRDAPLDHTIIEQAHHDLFLSDIDHPPDF